MTERYQATYSSTPASVIYAQSWPVPSVRKKYPVNLISSSNNQRKNFNSPWNKGDRQSAAKLASHQTNGCTERPHSWAKSMLKSHYPDWIEEDAHVKLDMAKEFKITLKMFRKLTQQVREVDEQLNSIKNPYSFKHHAHNQDSPGLYRSQLHLAVNKRNYTPQPWTTLKEKAEKPRPWSHLGVHTNNSSEYFNCISKRNIQEKVPSHDAGVSQEECRTVTTEPKKAFEKHRLDEELLYQSDNSEIDWPSDEKENDSLGYIDPVPSDWSERKLEQLEENFLPKEKEADPFMLRYFQLRRLEAETIENEKCPQKTEETTATLSSQNGSMKAMNNAKKIQLNKIYSANGKKSKEDCKMVKKSDKNLKKSTYLKPDVEFDKSSPLKSDLARRLEKDVGFGKKNSGTVPVNSISKKDKCLSARVRKDCKSNATSSKHLSRCRNVEHYDIVELATSFEPPSKDRICSKSRPVTAKSAKSKGLLPGKSWHSQRRFSLTGDQTCQSVRSDLPLTKPKSSKHRQKSAKRKTKRCTSSKF